MVNGKAWTDYAVAYSSLKTTSRDAMTTLDLVSAAWNAYCDRDETGCFPMTECPDGFHEGTVRERHVDRDHAEGRRSLNVASDADG